MVTRALFDDVFEGSGLEYSKLFESNGPWWFRDDIMGDLDGALKPNAKLGGRYDPDWRKDGGLSQEDRRLDARRQQDARLNARTGLPSRPFGGEEGFETEEEEAGESGEDWPAPADENGGEHAVPGIGFALSGAARLEARRRRRSERRTTSHELSSR